MKRIFLLAEHVEGKICPGSLGLSWFAREWIERPPGPAAWLLLGHRVDPLARELAVLTGSDVHALDHPALASYNAEAHAGALVPWLAEQDSWLLLLPHSSLGMDLAPALSFRLNAPYVSSLTGIHGQGADVTFTRETLYGKRVETLKAASTRRVVATVARREWRPDPEGSSVPGKVYPTSLNLKPTRSETLAARRPRRPQMDLTRAAAIVAAGRGIGDEKMLALLQELVHLLHGAALGASRPVCDRGWLPLEHQIGLTGQTVSPRLYLAFGISGAVQHLAGMQQSQCIVAVNHDPDAPIFRFAHYGIVEDVQVFLPALLKRLKEHKGVL
ncbi:MAG: electron transfer flavoprotein subunit alpha/FixB family protein [bacterium]